MTTVDSTISFALAVNRSTPVDVGGPVVEPHKLISRIKWASGTGTSEADEVWSDTRALSVGSEDLNLNDLDFFDTSGNGIRTGINFAVVKFIAIINNGAAGASGYIRVGGAASQAFEGTGYMLQAAGSKIDVVPGGPPLVWGNPVGVSTSSLNNLKIEAVTADGNYTVVVIGEKA